MPEGPTDEPRAQEAPEEPIGRRVADRYELESLLGRGGMASAYRALDTVTGKRLALKRLTVEGPHSEVQRWVELFEREFHTLTQLAHPRIVEAYDYGLDDGSPYYTMELLDGGDLQRLAPMAASDICTAAYEICSALSLLHSRRLVHRDVAPCNIRRTAHGDAKLIDFGLLSPMGPVGLIAGTPPFVAPETMNNTSLDGRSDLFSLGATLYFALTGRTPFAARRFERLQEAWQTSPPPPSKLVDGVPAALDDLLLAMLRLDAGSRPKSAAEVMERLLPLLGTPPKEELRAASAYLTTPRLVGRDDVIARFRRRAARAERRRGGGFVIRGDAGAGRSRMLDAFALEAKLAGATTIRASARDATTRFGVARALAAQLHAASPATSLAAARKTPETAALLFGETEAEVTGEPAKTRVLVDLTDPKLERAPLQVALRNWLLDFASEKSLAIAVDDMDRIDEPSAALLASLTWEAPKHRLLYAVSIESSDTGAAPNALSIVREHAEDVPLPPQSLDETAELLASVFGDVPNLRSLSQKLHELCGGRPRDCMTLAQFLVDTGAITYAFGSWTLPAEMPLELLPKSLEASLERQVSHLEPCARRIATLLALCVVGRLARAQLMRLPDAVPSEIDRAIDELYAARVLVGDTSGYALRHDSLAHLLTAQLTAAESAAAHQELATLHERADAHPLLVAHHKLLGERPEEGLDFILTRALDSDARVHLSSGGARELGTERTAKTFELALGVATRARRRKRELQALWVMLAGVSAMGEDAGFYYRLPPVWLARLKQDSGFHEWHAQDADPDEAARSMAAVRAAFARYGGLAEIDRVLSPPEAIKQLVSFVVFSISVSARVLDLELMDSLPQLLEPFAALNPMVAAMQHNAVATRLNGIGEREAAREGFLRVSAELDAVSGADLAYVDRVRASLSQTLAEIDVSLGIVSPWTERLEREQQDPNQGVGARYLRKLAALQQGDWEAAEQHRQGAELLALQTKARSMFSTLEQELEVHAMARDLTGLKQVRTAIFAMAAAHPGWMPVRRVADAHYLRLCGDLTGALAAAEMGIAESAAAKIPSPWLFQATAVAAEILVDLGRPEDARDRAEDALAVCEKRGMRYLARGLARAMAFAEARLEQFDAARARIDALIAEQGELGVTGLQLGQSYELAARIALSARDQTAFERFAALTAEQYRPGASSVLGALYERLMEDARLAAGSDRPELSSDGAHETEHAIPWRARVAKELEGCADRNERPRRALALLCEGAPPGRGHLLLFMDEGLTLAASNVPCTAASTLTAFARSYVHFEIDLNDAATTVEDDAPDESAPSAHWDSPDGIRFSPVLICERAGGALRVAGLAMLTEDAVIRTRARAGLVEAIARSLVEFGDARVVRAA